MTLDDHPKKWRNTIKRYLLWLQLPDAQGDLLFDTMLKSDQERFDAYILTLETPEKALKELETYAEGGEFKIIVNLVEKLPRSELEILIKTKLKRGKIVDNLTRMDIDELRELLILCSYPNNFLLTICFVSFLDPARKEALGL